MKNFSQKIKRFPNFNLTCILVLIPILRFIVPFSYDNDFWFTINQGRYVLLNGFPNKAISIIHDFDFIYQSWGTGTLFYSIYHYIGDYGIITLLLIVFELFAYFFYKLCLMVSNNKKISLITSIVVMLLYSFFMTTRPHIFTALNLTIILYLLESYYHTLNKKYLYFLPLIGLLQINMHGIYFLPIMIIISPYLINSFKFKIGRISSFGIEKKHLLITYLIMLLTGFINPYGYKTIIYGFSSYFSSSIMNNMIIELLAPNFHNLLGKLMIGIIILVYVIYFSSSKKIKQQYYLLLLGTSFLALDAVKSFWIFIICAFFPLAFILCKEKQDSELKYSKKYYITHIFIVIITSFIILYNLNVDKKMETESLLDYLDSQVEDKSAIKLYTDFNDGSYAEWRGYNCYFDPRAEIFLKANNHREDIIEEAHNLQTLKLDYHEFFDKYLFDYLLINKQDDVLYKLMKFDNAGYQSILEEDNYVLYQRIKK